MKKQTKGVILAVIFGGSLLFWATAASLPGITPEDPTQTMTKTGTPMDNFPDVQRAQFCGTGQAKSNNYVTEFQIPTPCTQPLAVVTDPNGNVWFTQTNAGRIAKFDPQTETFVEYNNTQWSNLPAQRSMMWGIDYAPDASLWFTDEAHDSIWKFSILDETYERTNYPKIADSLPQRLVVDGSKIIVNDFTGNKLTFLDPTQSAEGLAYLTIPSPVENSVTGGFGIDADNNVWYTNWIFQSGGVLVKLDQDRISEFSDNLQNETALFDVINIYQFPSGMRTPNGVSASPDGNIWILDTSSSFFFKFDPDSEIFTKYITSIPHESSYGNSTGIVKTPVSRPYWSEFDDQGRLIFNEQTANRIGVFDPKTESLVEYMVPSKNPNWADCENLPDCGLAQIFDVTVDGDKIWFTEWVENNIGLIDTSKPLPFDVELDERKIVLKRGEQTNLILEITPYGSESVENVSISTATTSLFSDIILDSDAPDTFQLNSNEPKLIEISITIGENALPDFHKVLIGAQTEEVVVAKYITVIVEQ